LLLRCAPEPQIAAAQAENFVPSAGRPNQTGAFNAQKVTMAQVTLIDRAGNPQRAGVHGAQAEDLLWSAGVDCGRWAPRLDAVSSVPQLSYARELLALQRRFGTVMTQRRRVPAHRPWEEPAHVHVHDDVELRVVVQGVLRLSLGP
jgi:hypothetical protein